MHEPERRRRLSLPAARAALPASSRPFPQPGPSPRSPSPYASLSTRDQRSRVSLTGPAPFRSGRRAVRAAFGPGLRAGQAEAGALDADRSAALADPVSPVGLQAFELLDLAGGRPSDLDGRDARGLAEADVLPQ